MFTFKEMELYKLEEPFLDKLLELKKESWLGTHNVTIANLSDQKKWFASLDSNVHNPRNLVLFADDLLPGSDTRDKIPKVGIFKISNVDYVSRTADVAWDIFKEHRKKGKGKRLVAAGSAFCFQVLNLRRLNAEILENNLGSQKCAEATGFIHEGTKRESVHKKGEFIDSRIYGLLASGF